MVRTFTNHRLSLQAEAASVRQYFTRFAATGTFKKIELVGVLQPSLKSPEYRIRIILKLGDRPKVFVEDPPLVKNPPHVYRTLGNALCLYYPSAINPDKPHFVRKMLIPWIAAWLCFYECWLVTGTWYGDEFKHDDEKIV